MYDAVRLFAKALDDLDRSRHIDVTPLDCDGDSAWVHGNSLVNYMKWVSSVCACLLGAPRGLLSSRRFEI